MNFVDYEKFREDLKRSCPKTPMNFRNIVDKAVERGLHGEAYRRERDRKVRLGRMAAPVAACLLLACTTVAAAELPAVEKFLAGLGNSRKQAEGLVQSDPDAKERQGELLEEYDEKEQRRRQVANVSETAETEEAVLTITNTYIDGSTLMLWADATDAADSSFEYSFGDHIYVNGVDCRKEYMVEEPAGSGHYLCKVSILDKIPEKEDGTLEVITKLYTPGGKDQFAFVIPADGLETVREVADQRLDLKEGSVEVSKISVAPSVIKMTLHYEITGQNAKECLEQYIAQGYALMDAQGKRFTDMDYMQSYSSSSCVEEDGVASETLELVFEGLDYTSKTITLVPYSMEVDEQGLRVPGTETFDEERSITISLE
ncbi:MAG: hypothetical protein K2I10_13780 [Lachnospiraceae bacterium]|nr:hypothetical protein [Lachnospiraceae bacterium]